jgi:hypothetical protein
MISIDRCRQYRLDCTRQLRIKEAPEGFGVAADDHHRLLKSCAMASGQFADRLHFLRYRQLFARLDHLLLSVVPLFDTMPSQPRTCRSLPITGAAALIATTRGA